MGIYLGNSPRHARSVSLVLNLDTGHVSPQYHVQHDNFFETVRPGAYNPKTASSWQRLAGLVDAIGTHLPKPYYANLEDAYQVVPAKEFENRAAEGDHDVKSTETSQNEGATIPIDSPNIDGILEDTDVPEKRSTRKKMITKRMRESLEQNRGRRAFSSTYYDIMHEFDYSIQQESDDPIAFLVKTDADTMYLHQALKEPDRDQFVRAVIREVNDHIVRKHWELIPISQVPEGQTVLDAVWSMKRKRHLLTREVYKWKARLNVHGGQQEYAINYFDTYAPVVTWPTIRLLLTLALLNGWITRQIDFVLAYPQADIEYDMYMHLPTGIELRQDSEPCCLRLKKNIYGQKQAGRTFYLYMVKGLLKLGYKQSSIDSCVFYRETTIFFSYVDDGIFIDISVDKIGLAIQELANEFDIEDKGDVSEYLGVKIDYLDDGRIKLYQPHLIEQILKELNINSYVKHRPTPAASTKILQRFQGEPSHQKDWHYRSVIGKLNFLEKSTRPDISYAVHQCARFSQDPKVSHSQAVEHVGKYLLGTKMNGIFLDPKRNASFDVYVDSDFVGNWNRQTAHEDESTSKSRSGYIIMFANCPLIWSSKLQTMVGLSTTECEYMALSQALRETIPLMQLMKELKKQGISTYSIVPRIHCKCFEDNSGALELARLPKMRPRTKHLNQALHHFRSFVKDGSVKVLPIESINQKGDIFTKPLAQNQFVRLRRQLLGW